MHVCLLLSIFPTRHKLIDTFIVDAAVMERILITGVDLNTASPEVLRRVPGLRNYVDKIIEYRAKHGPFRSKYVNS